MQSEEFETLPTGRPDAPASPTRPRVLAIIVAYNSPVALERCLRSLDAQSRVVDGVLVIDNSEPVPADISGLTVGISSRTKVLRAGSNMGPAGGFALGLASFIEDGGYSHAWLMDDDCYPEPTSLQLLLEGVAGVRPGLVAFPSAVYEATGVAMNYPGWSGVLLDRLAVRMAGLPRAEMFWWAEDTEYLQFRLPRKGVIVVRVPESRVVYDLIRRVGGRPAWKYYYEVRNTIWMHFAIYKGSRIGRLPRPLVRMFGSAIMSKGRIQKLRMYGRGFTDGIFNRLGHQVVPRPAGSPEQEGHG